MISSSMGDPPQSLLYYLEPTAIPHPTLTKTGPYLMIAALQAYTILTVVRCFCEPTWIVHESSVDKSGSTEDPLHPGTIGRKERWFLILAIVFTLTSCASFTLRVMDKLPWLRRISVLGAYLQSKSDSTR